MAKQYKSEALLARPACALHRTMVRGSPGRKRPHLSPSPSALPGRTPGQRDCAVRVWREAKRADRAPGD